MRHEETLGVYRHVLILMVMIVSQVYNSTRLGVFFKILFFFSNLYTHSGAQTHNPEIWSCMFYCLSQPGTPKAV